MKKKNIAGKSQVRFRKILERTRVLLVLFISCCWLFATFSGCAVQREARSEETAAKPANNFSTAEPFPALPGWLQEKFPPSESGDLLHLVYESGSAAMILKEFHSSAATKAVLAKENICVLGNISLREKLAQPNVVGRIIRTPAPLTNEPEFCVYVFESAGGRLRRVLVFRNDERMYELELRQEQSNGSLALFSDDQLMLAKSVLAR
ncbi:MAG: hypothetical protein KGJ59_06850 [Bacteroidota bacterium]|nr:hypothetical protein [Bacteroidota bacterium]